MFCYHCGCNLSEHDFCTACGVDVALYKKIMCVSNMYYNEGLDRANVRDLSGAVNSLRQSLKFNKNHIEARNLLGLVYFEMGEAVAALSEWVISKNLRPEKNVADDYINMIQSNASRLDTMNQTIKKYNQAYTYCIQGSKDLATIQLKKVLSMNPRLVRAHQLLALLYIDSEQWDRAKRELRKVLEIDRNNTLALRYMKEVDLVLLPDTTGKAPVKYRNDDSVRYQSDNEIIIQPVNMKEQKRSGVAALLNIGIGIVIGMAAVFFLVMPGRLAEVNNEANLKITEIGEQLDAKSATIEELESALKVLEEEKNLLQQELEGIVGENGTLSIIDNLFEAASGYLETRDAVQAAADLKGISEEVDVTATSESFQKLFNTLLAAFGPELSSTLHKEGVAFYNSGEYEQAIAKLTDAVYYNEANVEALYQLAQVYRKKEDTANAIATYQKVVELFPGTRWEQNSKNYISQLSQ